MEIPQELEEKFKFARQKSKLPGTIRDSFFVIIKVSKSAIGVIHSLFLFAKEMRDQREGHPKRDGLKLAVSPSAESRIISRAKFFEYLITQLSQSQNRADSKRGLG